METIRFGLSATLSGRYASLGKESLKGLILWADNTNEKGGIYVLDEGKTLPVELVYEDDKSKPENTGKITRFIIDQKEADILLGPYSSSLTLAAAEVSSEFNRTLWNYGGSSDEITQKGYKNIISSITPASKYFAGIIDFLKSAFGKNLDVAVIYADNSGFSSNVAGGMINYAESSGHSTYKYTFTSGRKDFNEILNKINDRKHRIIFFVGRFEDDVNFARTISDKLDNFDAVSLVGASIEQFRTELGNSVNGFISTSQWDPAINIKPDTGPDVSEFCKSYTEKFDRTPDYLSAQSYNIGNIIEKCISETGTLDEMELRKKAKRLSFKTFYGDFQVDSDTGMQNGHQMLVVQWQNGKKKIIHPEKYSSSQFK